MVKQGKAELLQMPTLLPDVATKRVVASTGLARLRTPSRRRPAAARSPRLVRGARGVARVSLRLPAR